MQINFFSWIREGVRQSVLLGVHDAVEQIGPVADYDDFSNRVRDALSQPPETTERIGQSAQNSSGRRKRLGRSLKDVDSEMRNS